MTRISITSDLNRAIRAVGAAPQAVGRIQSEALHRFGEAYKAELVRETPRGQGEASGRKRLYENYEVTETASSTSAEYRIRNRAFFLKWVLRGRPAVVAKGRALRFVIRGVVIFRKRVKAAPANNYPARVKATMRGRRRELLLDVARGVVSAMRGS